MLVNDEACRSLGHSRNELLEMTVADMIRKNHTSKEILDLLRISPGTVEFYRDRIRGKLGLKKQKINLKNYLRTNFSE